MDRTSKKEAEAMDREDVSTTVPVRLSRYLRDRLLKESQGKKKCIPRLLLEILDPVVAKKFKRFPANRGDTHAHDYS